MTDIGKENLSRKTDHEEYIETGKHPPHFLMTHNGTMLFLHVNEICNEIG